MEFSSYPTTCADFVRVRSVSGPCRVRVVEFSFKSAESSARSQKQKSGEKQKKMKMLRSIGKQSEESVESVLKKKKKKKATEGRICGKGRF